MKPECEKWLRSQFGDDREAIEAVYAEYVGTLSELAERLSAARQSGDAASLDRALHTIKGSAAMVGDRELSELAQRARGEANAALLDSLASSIAASMMK